MRAGIGGARGRAATRQMLEALGCTLRRIGIGKAPRDLRQRLARLRILLELVLREPELQQRIGRLARIRPPFDDGVKGVGRALEVV
jgi:hypothetical protein